MRDHEAGFGELLVAVEQQVEVDRARPVAGPFARPPQCALDLEQAVEEDTRRLDAIAALGRPVLVGISRKSSLGKLAGDPDATTGTTAASVAAAVLAFERGASILRAHDVREHVEALTVAAAVAG